MPKTIRIVTRKSMLALWQGNFVRQSLLANHADLAVEIIGLSTRGDRIIDTPLSKIGGKGLFVKELENALLKNRADIAVHSMKDIGVALPKGLQIGCILARHNPLDALVSNRYESLQEMPAGAVVGSCSLRRISQLKRRFPHLLFKDLRGNVDTRLAKLDAGQYDAIILAAAGLERLQMPARIAALITPDICLPAIAQGTIGIECREHDAVVLDYLKPLEDADNVLVTKAERAINEKLQGDCQTPIAAYAVKTGVQLRLRALVASPSGKTLLMAEKTAEASTARQLGLDTGEALMRQGAGELLRAHIG